jgi:hypothetical protein
MGVGGIYFGLNRCTSDYFLTNFSHGNCCRAVQHKGTPKKKKEKRKYVIIYFVIVTQNSFFNF